MGPPPTVGRVGSIVAGDGMPDRSSVVVVSPSATAATLLPSSLTAIEAPTLVVESPIAAVPHSMTSPKALWSRDDAIRFDASPGYDRSAQEV